MYFCCANNQVANCNGAIGAGRNPIYIVIVLNVRTVHCLKFQQQLKYLFIKHYSLNSYCTWLESKWISTKLLAKHCFKVMSSGHVCIVAALIFDSKVINVLVFNKGIWWQCYDTVLRKTRSNITCHPWLLISSMNGVNVPY